MGSGMGSGSGSELGCCANLVRIVLIIINILFGVLGIVVFAIGIWAVVENLNYSFVTDNNVISGAVILIVAGIVTMIICFVGIVGAIFKARPLLILYAVAVAIIVILEIAAGIAAFLFRDNVVDGINVRSLEALKLYADADDPDYREDVNDFVTFVQETLNCCGVNNASDWYNENIDAVLGSVGMDKFPACAECNPSDDENCMLFDFTGVFNVTNLTRVFNFSIAATVDGCGTLSSNAITVFFYSVGGIGIAFGIVEIVGVLFALFLCCCITSARKQEVV